MEVGKTYNISGAQIKPCDKTYNKTGCDYEIHSKMGTVVEEVAAAPGGGGLTYNFTKIAEVENTDVNKSIDVTGIIKMVNDVREVTSKTSGRQMYVRDMSLVDDSMKEVRISLWGKDAQEFQGSVGCAVEVKGAVVTEFQGKNLAFRSDTIFQIKILI